MKIKELTNIWAKQTYKESILNSEYTDEEKETILSICKELDICDKTMDGYSIQSLPRTAERKTGIRTYSEIFDEAYKEGKWSPADFVSKVILEARKNNLSDEMTIGVAARALRGSYAASIREMTLLNHLKEIAKKRDPNVSFERSVELDQKKHTDVLMKNYHGKDYQMWSFMYSERSLSNIIEKLLGVRGKLPDDLHVLCPVHTNIAKDFEQNERMIKKLEARIAKYEQVLNTCSDKAAKKRENAEKILVSAKADLIVKGGKRVGLAFEKENIDIFNGWYAYSAKGVERILDEIDNGTVIDYEVLAAGLMYPQNTLSKTIVFKK